MDPQALAPSGPGGAQPNATLALCFDTRTGVSERMLDRLRRLCRGVGRGKPAVITCLVDDAQHAPVIALELAASTLKLSLPAGTYHVTACNGPRRRVYTLALDAGATHALRLSWSEAADAAQRGMRPPP